jgi:hypothetical protein
MHGKLLLNLSLGLCTPQKMLFYALFWPHNRPMPEKWVITVYAISQGRSIFAHIPVGGAGSQWGVGGKPLNRAKVRSRQNCGRLFADCRLHRPLSIFCLN